MYANPHYFNDKNMNCDVSKCHASCCYNVPHTKYTLFTNKKRIVTPYKRLKEHGCNDEGRMMYVPVTDEDFQKNKCPFLREDYRCNIYDKRPYICRVWGEPPTGTKSKIYQCGWRNGTQCDNDIRNIQENDAVLAEMAVLLAKGQLKL